MEWIGQLQQRVGQNENTRVKTRYTIKMRHDTRCWHVSLSFLILTAYFSFGPTWCWQEFIHQHQNERCIYRKTRHIQCNIMRDHYMMLEWRDCSILLSSVFLTVLRAFYCLLYPLLFSLAWVVAFLILLYPCAVAVAFLCVFSFWVMPRLHETSLIKRKRKWSNYDNNKL